MSYGALKQRLTTHRINELLRAAFGRGAAMRRATVCRGGLFNTSYRLRLFDGRDVILRVAPPGTRPLMRVERDLMRREVAALEWMRDAKMPVPHLLHADFSRRLIDRDWVIVSCERGANWHYQLPRLDERPNDDLMRQLGALAKKLHATANPDGWFGYPAPFKRHKTWSGFVLAYAESLEKDALDFGCVPLPPELSPVALAERIAGALDKVRVPRLIHGDLWPRNILVEQGRITAILDCDRALWGDPRFEWVLYGYPFRPAFWRAYGPKAPADRNARLRNLLYRGCGGFQASIEEWSHFRHAGKAAEMRAYAVRDLSALLKSL